MTLVGDAFPEIPAPKNMVRKMCKEPCFRGPLGRQQGKWLETLLQSEQQHVSTIFNHCEGNCIGKSLF